MINAPLLINKMTATGTTGKALADAIGMTDEQLIDKLVGSEEFCLDEVNGIRRELQLNTEDSLAIFFPAFVNSAPAHKEINSEFSSKVCAQAETVSNAAEILLRALTELEASKVADRSSVSMLWGCHQLLTDAVTALDAIAADLLKK